MARRGGNACACLFVLGDAPGEIRINFCHALKKFKKQSFLKPKFFSKKNSI